VKGPEYLYAEWCAIFLVWVADKTHVRSRTGTAAYTPSWAQSFAKQGRWGSQPQRGAFVFFDWAGSKSRLSIDHVGVVEKVHADGTITTIEGNKGNAVRRVERSHSIVGYGYWA
jgi:surface antigen